MRMAVRHFSSAKNERDCIVRLIAVFAYGCDKSLRRAFNEGQCSPGVTGRLVDVRANPNRAGDAASKTRSSDSVSERR